MDTRDTPEQAELRRSARRLAGDLGPPNVLGLDDAERSARLAAAARAAGWAQLRDDDGSGHPIAGGVEAGIVAEALGAHVADVPFLGPLLAADLGRRVGAEASAAIVGSGPSLEGPAVVPAAATTEPIFAIDARGEDRTEAWVLTPAGESFRLARVALPPAEAEGHGTDLTRSVRVVPAGARVEPIAGDRVLTRDDLVRWTALGLALTSADLVGIMRGVIDLTVDYAAQRKQYGVAVGSFQAVQHLLADARCLMEGSLSVAQHATWAADELAPGDARTAGRVAKAYCVRAARTVCETAVQVHGGIGNTWECMVHVYLRRALLSSAWLGDDGLQLLELQGERLGAG